MSTKVFRIALIGSLCLLMPSVVASWFEPKANIVIVAPPPPLVVGADASPLPAQPTPSPCFPSVDKRLTEDWLTGWYTTYNSYYFDNELPPAGISWVEGSSGPIPTLALAYTVRNPNEEEVWQPFLIGLSRQLYYGGAAATRLVLLHEMVHIRLWSLGPEGRGHGAMFQAEMLRLATKGAFADLW